MIQRRLLGPADGLAVVIRQFASTPFVQDATFCTAGALSCNDPKGKEDAGLSQPYQQYTPGFITKKCTQSLSNRASASNISSTSSRNSSLCSSSSDVNALGVIHLRWQAIRAFSAVARAQREISPAPYVAEDGFLASRQAAVGPKAADFRAQHEMRVMDDSGLEIPDPVLTFEEAGFPGPLLETVKKAGYKAPTPIQAQAWPLATAGRDLIAIASTGSGKTAGYLVPALAHIRKAARKAAEEGQGRRMAASVLIVAPTRELAVQIQDEAQKLGRPLGLRTACLYGGAGRGGQLNDIIRNPHMIVATPGRLLDFAEGGELDLSRVSYLVLDEADRMLDMGFEPQLQQLCTYLPRTRQTLFFSATWPREVQAIANGFTSNKAVKLFVGKVSDRPVAATSITQLVRVVSNHDKLAVLEEYLASKPAGSRVLVFVNTKSRCDWLEHTLAASSIRVACIHGDKVQARREAALQNFRTGRVPVLIATEVAARGIDVPNVTAVVNFDMANAIEDYVHRIGRTGRAGASGESLTLMTTADASVARDLMKVMEQAGQDIPEDLQEMASSRRFGGGSGSGRQGMSRGGGYGRERGSFRGHGGSRDGSAGHEGGRRSHSEDSPLGRTRLDGEFGGRSPRSDDGHERRGRAKW